MCDLVQNGISLKNNPRNIYKQNYIRLLSKTLKVLTTSMRPLFFCFLFFFHVPFFLPRQDVMHDLLGKNWTWRHVPYLRIVRDLVERGDKEGGEHKLKTRWKCKGEK